MTTVKRIGRTALAVVSVLLAFLIIADTASAQAESVTHRSVVATEAPVTTISASTSGHGHHEEPGTEDCDVVRHAPAPVTAPVPQGKSGCVCGCDIGSAEPTSAGSLALSGRHHAVPVSRSGELPVLLQVFRS